MRLTRIEFNGYKRLAQTSCNVDGKLIAFVGPNEAGKTSVLEALVWLDAPDGTPLPGGVPTRGLELPEHEPVVTATYRVDEKDHRALSMFNVTAPPLVYRQAVGEAVREGSRAAERSVAAGLTSDRSARPRPRPPVEQGRDPRGKAVSDWCKAHEIGAPGKTVIASRLVNNPDQIALEPAAIDYLKELHAKLTEILKL